VKQERKIRVFPELGRESICDHQGTTSVTKGVGIVEGRTGKEGQGEVRERRKLA